MANSGKNPAKRSVAQPTPTDDQNLVNFVKTLNQEGLQLVEATAAPENIDKLKADIKRMQNTSLKISIGPNKYKEIDEFNRGLMLSKSELETLLNVKLNNDFHGLLVCFGIYDPSKAIEIPKVDPDPNAPVETLDAIVYHVVRKITDAGIEKERFVPKIQGYFDLADGTSCPPFKGCIGTIP